MNTYSYVGNSPLRWYDRYGLEQGTEDGGDWITGSVYNDFTLNGSLGTGGSGIFMIFYGSADSGLAVSSKGSVCAYSTICTGYGWNTPIGGELGFVGSIGKGEICDGQVDELYGAYWAGGAGIAGQGQILEDGTYGRILLGVGGAPDGPMAGVGGMKCAITYLCPVESDNCKCKDNK